MKLEKHLGDEFIFTDGEGISNIDLDALLVQHKNLGKVSTNTAVRPPARFGSIIIEGTLSRSLVRIIVWVR